MTNTKHTQGPWIVSGNSVGGPAIYTADKSKAIADVRTCGGVHVNGPQHPRTEANARLIAAAPDLLEALITAHATLDRDGDEWGICAQLRAAIAKATGEQL